MCWCFTFKVLLIVDSVFLWWTASCGTEDLLKTLNIKGLVQVLLFIVTMATWRRRRQRLEERRGVMKSVMSLHLHRIRFCWVQMDSFTPAEIMV